MINTNFWVMNKKYTFFFRSWNIFSNWYKCEFEEDGVKFDCVEKYMMYKKAVLFGDRATGKKILNLTKHDPKKAKALGRQVSGFNGKIWDANKLEIVKQGCRLKFTQNTELLEKLLATEGNLVEASPYDRIWGCGLSENDKRIHDEKNWTGQNLLGKILTELREELKNE